MHSGLNDKEHIIIKSTKAEETWRKLFSITKGPGQQIVKEVQFLVSIAQFFGRQGCLFSPPGQ